jgi:hypothetical protein
MRQCAAELRRFAYTAIHARNLAFCLNGFFLRDSVSSPEGSLRLWSGMRVCATKGPPITVRCKMNEDS